MKHKEPIAHAISYVERDGTREVDFRQAEHDAVEWAKWCRRDGCAEVTVSPIYTESEIASAVFRSRDV